MQIYGIPKKLYSDRDPDFEAKLFYLLGVKKLRTTGYNPKATGLTEESNKFTKSFLTKYSNAFPEKWEESTLGKLPMHRIPQSIRARTSPV